MKKSILLLLVISFISCNSTKKNSSPTASNESTTNCPDDGDCTIVIHKNKKLNILTDGIGSRYYQILDNENTSVIHFEYKKKIDENLQDGNYVEEIVFEIQNDVKSLLLIDNELQSTKMLYGRHCYCKGQAGLFNVSNGKLILDQNNNKIKINLDFKINDVPQLITSISEIIQ